MQRARVLASRCSSLVLLTWLLPCVALAHVGFTSKLFTDNMVLQRNMPLPIWGSANVGAGITVSINGQSKSATADAAGHWQVTLDPMAAGGPYDLTVTGEDTVVLQNVMIGEVWLCSGQSNMVIQGPSRALRAQYPDIRALKRRRWGDKPAGTAFWFAVELQRRLGVPIGLINEAVSGSSIRTWLAPEALFDSDPEVPALIATWGRWGNYYTRFIAPLRPYAFRGALWWQGEADVVRPRNYSHLLPALIRSWRSDWQVGDFPFFFVQVPTGEGLKLGGSPAPLPPEPPSTDLFPLMRDAYFQTLALPNTRMVISLDLDGSIHPRDKVPYGTRLAELAYDSVYNQPVVASGPLFESLSLVAPNRFRVHFSPNTAEGLYALGGTEPQGFAIAADDGKFLWANAQIDGDEVIVWNDSIATPRFVRYAWGDRPTWANLFNGANMTAAPFSADILVAPPAPTYTPTLAPTATVTPTITATQPPQSPPPTGTSTATPTGTPTAVSTRTLTATPTPTLTPTPTATTAPTCRSGYLLDDIHVKILRNGDSPGAQTLKLRGTLTISVLDEILGLADTGFLLGVNDSTNQAIFSHLIPGGSGWTVNNAQTRWTYRAPVGASGITRITIWRPLLGLPGVFKFMVSGTKSNFRLPLTSLPAKLIVAFGTSPQAYDKQCGTRTLSPTDGEPPACKPLAAGNVLLCH